MKQKLNSQSDAGQARWYAVFSKPRQERIALENLERQGFRCFLPLARNPYQRQRSAKRERVEPLFARYLFLEAIPDRQNLGSVRSTRGVVGLVRRGTEPLEVPPSVVHGLLSRRCPDSGLIELEPVSVRPGDRVRVFDGPLAGVEGILQHHCSETRAVLLMGLLGRETTVEVDSLMLKRAG